MWITIRLFLLLICTSAHGAPVYFSDSILKEAIETTLGITDPNPSDMEELTSLTAIDKRITDLTGLEYATNLQELYLRGNKIEDISVLASLTNLYRLEIDNNRIRNISALSGLTELNHLNIHDNIISSINALAGLDQLEYLNIHDNRISQLDAIAGLTNLRYLYIDDNWHLRSISSLSQLFNLEVLSLRRNNNLNNYAYCDDLESIYSNNPSMKLYYEPPSASPKGLVASNGVYPNHVKLKWDAVCGGPKYVIYYQVSRSLTVMGEKVPISPWQMNLSFEDTTAQHGETYYYWVRIAVSNDGKQPGEYTSPEAGSLAEIETIYVDDNAPGDPTVGDSNESDPLEDGTSNHPFDSIQEAINTASEGAIIAIKPGTYNENLQLFNRGLRLTADDPNAMRYPEVIGDYSQPTITIDSNRDVKHSISGLVISGGLNGIDCRSGDLTITHCVISGNKGFGLSCQDSHIAIQNCTIADNFGLAEGGGFRLLEGSEVSLANSILWNNYPSNIHLQDDTVLHARYSNISGLDLLESGEGNMDTDPFFALTGYWKNPIGTSDQETWVPGNYHLQSQRGRWDPLLQIWVMDLQTSPCIDAGDPQSPMEYEPDPNGGVINLGAYGGTRTASKSRP